MPLSPDPVSTAAATAATAAAAAEDAALRLSCRGWLNGHRPQRSAQETLAALAALPEAASLPDVYGEGEVIAGLEREVAALLGKPSASFFHKGVAAQLAALRVWTGGVPDARVALHRQSHIELDEQQAHEHVFGMRGQRLGEADAPFGVAALEALPELPAVVVMELPLRRGGYVLPEWAELEAVSRWCRERGVPLHFDGARLWEAAAHYGRPLPEIAALADSVYVSFYKGLGGLAGCVLAGPADFVAKTAVWKTRLAGNIFTVFPYVLSALLGLRTQLPRMAEYRARAQRLAPALSALEGVQLWPAVPQVNAFQLHLPGTPEAVREGLRGVAREDKFWLGARAVASRWPGHAMLEVVIGDAADDWRDDAVVAYFARVIASSR